MGVLEVVSAFHKVGVALPYSVCKYCRNSRSLQQIPEGSANRSRGRSTGRSWTVLGDRPRYGHASVVIPVAVGSGIQVRRSGFQSIEVRRFCAPSMGPCEYYLVLPALGILVPTLWLPGSMSIILLDLPLSLPVVPEKE